MVHDRANWRMNAWRAALALAALPFAYLDSAAVHAQSIMRSPSLNIESRVPSISVAPRIDPNIAARAVIAIGRTTPNLKTYQGCSYAYRDGGCKGTIDTSADGGGAGAASDRKASNGGRRSTALTALNASSIANQIVGEIDGSLSEARADELARRHRLARIGSQYFPLIDATIGLFRIND